MEYSRGPAPRVHRTNSIDYAVVISGEIDMELEKGTEVHLEAGDVLVQRGTGHCRINRGKAPCVMAFVLVDAKPVVAGGRGLNRVRRGWGSTPDVRVHPPPLAVRFAL